MKALPSFLLLLAALAALVGCGADSNTSTAQEDAFKNGQKATPVTIPPDAGKRPANFKSSLDGEGAHAPAPGSVGAATGGK